MSNPKEKAEELVWKFYHNIEHTISNEYAGKDWEIAKQCAILSVDEILKLNHPYVIVYESFKDNVMENMTQKHYWQEVKIKLEKL
jgi:hypothetical protein